MEFVTKGEFGLASGAKPDGTYQRVWFAETVEPEEVSFEYDVFLLRKDKAKAFKTVPKPADQEQPKQPEQPTGVVGGEESSTGGGTTTMAETMPVPSTVTLKISGAVPPELWNRFGSKVIPKVRAGQEVQVKVELSCRLDSAAAGSAETDIRQILQDLGLGGVVKVEKEE